MLELMPSRRDGNALRILCIGAHCDDIEIGCGGVLLTLQQAGMVERIDWMVLSGSPARRAESERARDLLIGEPARGELVFGNFRDGSMPAQYGEVKAFFEALKDRPRPDLVFTHERDDRHQDHRIANEMTWNTFRDQLVLEYEIPKWDGGLGQPNFYVPISRDLGKRKVAALLECFGSQADRHWFTAETFHALLKLRGIECRSESGWAEAFHARKLCLGAPPRQALVAAGGPDHALNC